MLGQISQNFQKKEHLCGKLSSKKYHQVLLQIITKINKNHEDQKNIKTELSSNTKIDDFVKNNYNKQIAKKQI